MSVTDVVERSEVLAELFGSRQFSIPQAIKERLLLEELRKLVDMHSVHCEPYRRIVSGLGWTEAAGLDELPYLPVGLFKSQLLSSVPQEEVFKIMTSSGTTRQSVSQIVLDKQTAALQSRALAAVMGAVLPAARMPMIIVDSPSVIRDRTKFSARGAGLLGMMPFGHSHFFALDDQMRLDVGGLHAFIDRHRGDPVLVFGFTFMVWQYFVQEIVARSLEIDLSGGVLIHSGGWKKLVDQAVKAVQFGETVRAATGLARVHNFYGMVEQVGSVFLEGEDGFLYPPNFSDVIVRDPVTWAPAAVGQPGVIEVLSVLPRSYPGHILLTEDLGIVHGVGDPATGWTGKQLEVLGRVPSTELRGCSDTHAAHVNIEVGEVQ